MPFEDSPRNEVQLATLQPVPAAVVDGSKGENGDGCQVIVEVGDVRQVPPRSQETSGDVGSLR